MMRDNRDPKDLQRAIPRAGRKGVGRREWLGKGRVGTAADLSAPTPVNYMTVLPHFPLSHIVF